MNTITSRNTVEYYLGTVLPRIGFIGVLIYCALFGSPLSILVLATLIVADIKMRGA